MSADRNRPFDPAEIADRASRDTAAEDARALAMARELERLARVPAPRPSGDFVDRAWAAVAAEPVPSPAAAALAALRRHSPRALAGSIRDAGRVAFGLGRPPLVRAQALAVVLAAMAVMLTIGGATAVGAISLLRGPDVRPTPVVVPSASPSPAPAVSPSPSTRPTAGPSGIETPRPTATGGGATTGPGASSTPSPSQSASPGEPRGSESPRPSQTPKPSQTAKPSQTPKPSHTSGGGGG